MDSTFNPTRQYFFQIVFNRAKNPNDDLPPLDPYISSYLNPEVRIYEDTQPLMSLMRKEFKFTRKELAKDKVAKKKTLMWKDVIEN